MDILSTRVRALVYPVTANGDQEQSVRAAKLARMRVLTVLDREQVQPVRLALEILRALRSTPPHITLNLAGAENSASLLWQHLMARNAHASQTRRTYKIAEERRRVSRRGGNQIGETVLCA